MDDKFKDLCERAISAQLSEREKSIRKDISRIKAEGNAGGMLCSSVTVNKIRESLENELEIQSIIIWQTIVRVLSSIGCHDLNYEILKKTFTDFFETSYQKLEAILAQNSGRYAMQLGMQRDNNLLKKKSWIGKKQEVDIELFVESTRNRKHGIQTEAPLNNYNFYGNIGAVQTGLHASANIVQNISKENRDEICRLLSQVRDTLISLQESNLVQKDEIIEMLNNCLDEIKSQKPNSTRVKALLTAVAQTIQTTASLIPAYQTLKKVLIYFGICLP